MIAVGLIANPAAGHDVRRLSSLASTSTTLEKARTLARVLRGLEGAGVRKVVICPDTARISAHAAEIAGTGLPLKHLSVKLEGSPSDTLAGARALAEQCPLLIALGGDGTQRLVAQAAPDAMLLPLASGTNNAASFFIDGTLAGLAAGLLARQPSLQESLSRAKRAHVQIDGQPAGFALVDVVLTRRCFPGAVSLTEVEALAEAVFAFALPESVGAASAAGRLRPVGRLEACGLHVRYGTGRRVSAVVAPGRMASVALAEVAEVPLDAPVAFEAQDGVLALDGEGVVAVTEKQRALVCLRQDGPYLVDPWHILRMSAALGSLP